MGVHCSKIRRCKHTCYCARLFGVLAANDEHDIPLAGIDVVIFQEEDFVYAILLERTKLDKKANSPS